MNALYKKSFVLKIPTFWGFYAWLLIGVKRQKGSLIGESDVITLYCQPSLRLRKPFLSFNTNQKPRIKSPKSGAFENKNYIERSPDPFSSRPNIKEEKAVWLRETKYSFGLLSLIIIRASKSIILPKLIEEMNYLLYSTIGRRIRLCSLYIIIY